MLLIGESLPVEKEFFVQSYVDAGLDCSRGTRLIGITLAFDPMEKSKSLRLGFFPTKGADTTFDNADERTVTQALAVKYSI